MCVCVSCLQSWCVFVSVVWPVLLTPRHVQSVCGVKKSVFTVCRPKTGLDELKLEPWLIQARVRVTCVYVRALVFQVDFKSSPVHLT